MDPFDEFEFKPLTDGLGFHKKKVNLSEGLKASGVLRDELKGTPNRMPDHFLDEVSKPTAKVKTFEEVLSALETVPVKRTSEFEFTEPLPHKKPAKVAMDVDIEPSGGPGSRSPFPQPEAYRPAKMKKVPLQSELANVGTRRGAADSPRPRLKPATVNFGSAILDFVIVLAFSLVFMVAMFMVTKVDVNLVMGNIFAHRMTQVSVALLFAAVMQIYLITSRSFYGCTIGEWTFDLQVGEENEQAQDSYPLKVTLRSFLVLGTGVVVLPLLSLILGRDIAGQLTGARLFQAP